MLIRTPGTPDLISGRSTRPSATRSPNRWDPDPYGSGEEWPVRVDRHLADGVEPDDVQRWVRTASLLHSTGDAMDVAVVDGRIVGVRGRVDDRVNHGRLRPKDLFGWQPNASSDRLTRPLVRRRGKLVETDWDTEILHVARDVARWSQNHVRSLAEIGPDHGVRMDADPRWTRRRPWPALARRLAMARRPRRRPGILLLADLRHVHRVAAGVSLDGELLAQAAQGMKQLLELAHDCHPETLRQMRWANALLKESATQVIAS